MSRGHSLVVAFWVWIAAAILAPCATFAYDGQDQTGLDYDSVRESTFGYDAGSALATDERKNGMVGSRVLFDKPAEFLAAKIAPGLRTAEQAGILPPASEQMNQFIIKPPGG